MTLSICCPAKVNLALSIGQAHRDRMHPIASWMIAVDFSDTLRLTRAAGDTSTFNIAFANDAPQPQPIDWPIEQDLAYRAHALLQNHLGRTLPVDLSLEKRIPAGAGLGGGSSDAAGVLVGMNDLYQLNLQTHTLIEWSQSLGSDVAFAVAALRGQSSAIVSGLGETLEPAPRNNSVHLVLIFPPLRCSTQEVYQAFDASPSTADVDEPRVRSLAELGSLPADAPFNDLAKPAMSVEPRLGAALTQLRSALSLPVHITGSGAAMFIITPTAIAAKALAKKVTTLTELPAIATQMLAYRATSAR